MTIAEHLEAVMDEVDKMDRRLAACLKNPDRKPLGRDEIAFGNVLGDRSITPEGARHLWDAANVLLEREKLQSRISVSTAQRCLDTELQAEIKRAREKDRWSYHGVVKRAAAALHDTKTFSGNCFFPAFITHSDEAINLTFGPVRIVSRDIFDAEYSRLIDDQILRATKSNGDRDAPLARILNGWKTQSEPYAFMVIVTIKDFEQSIARPVARQAAEFVLNLLRLMAPHRMGPRIRLAGDSKPETEQAFLTLTDDGVLGGIFSQGGEGAILPDDWSDALLRNIGDAKPMIDALADRLVCGDPFTDPVIERIRYADQLFTEAFQDTSPRQALVKIVSALEALCVLPRDEKSRTLQLRCALAGSRGDPDYIRAVRACVANAYRVRNDVVHGDAPELHEAANAIADLQLHLFHIVLHLWKLLVWVHNTKKPQSIRALRRELKLAFETERQRYEEIWNRMGLENPIDALIDEQTSRHA